jgi:hypothetical protein
LNATGADGADDDFEHGEVLLFLSCLWDR